MMRPLRKAAAYLRGLRPHVVDRRAFAMVIVAFGMGVFLLSWQGRVLGLEVEGASLGWVVLVAFGMSWHGEWGSGWRVGAGLVAGSLAALGTYYGVMSRLPVTALVFGLVLGVVAAVLALLCHALPRVLGFAGAVVGFGVGLAAARSFPLRPTTPADDLFSVMLTVSLCLVVGVFGSMVMRAVLLRMGTPAAHDAKLVLLSQQRRRGESLEASEGLRQVR